jgi:hypothetical protein
LSPPEVAKARATPSASADRTFTQHLADCSILGHDVDVRATANMTIGGSSDNAWNDWQVNPAGPL